MDDTQIQQQSTDESGGQTSESTLPGDRDIINDGQGGNEATAKITEEGSIPDIVRKEALQSEIPESDSQMENESDEKGETEDLEKEVKLHETQEGALDASEIESVKPITGDDHENVEATEEQSDLVQVEKDVGKGGTGEQVPYEVDSILLSGSELASIENANDETNGSPSQNSADIEVAQSIDKGTEEQKAAGGNEGTNDETVVLQGASEEILVDLLPDLAQSASESQITADENVADDGIQQVSFESELKLNTNMPDDKPVSTDQATPDIESIEQIASGDSEVKQEIERLEQDTDVTPTQQESNIFDVDDITDKIPTKVDETIEHFEPDLPQQEPVSPPAAETSDTPVPEELPSATAEDEDRKEVELKDNLQDKSNDIAEANVSDSDGSQENSVPSLPDDTSSSDIVVLSTPETSGLEIAQQNREDDLEIPGDFESASKEKMTVEQEIDDTADINRDPDQHENTIRESVSELSPQVVQEESVSPEYASASFSSPVVEPDIMDIKEMESAESGFEESEDIIPSSSDIKFEDDVNVPVLQTNKAETEPSEVIGAVEEIPSKYEERVSDNAHISDDHGTATMQKDAGTADVPAETDDPSKMAHQDDLFKEKQEEITEAVSDAEVPEAATLIPDIPEQATAPSDIGAVSLQSEDNLEAQDFNDEKPTLSQEFVADSDQSNTKVEHVIASDQYGAESSAFEVKNTDDNDDKVNTVQENVDQENEAINPPIDESLEQASKENVEDIIPDKPHIRDDDVNKHDLVTDVVSTDHEEVETSHDTSSMDTPLLDTTPSEKKPVMKEEPVKPDSAATVPTTQYEEQYEGSRRQDEKAPLVTKAKDDGRPSYGTSDMDDEDAEQKQPSNFYARLMNFVHAHCTIL